MTLLAPLWLFLILGPIFGMLGAWRLFGRRRNVHQARTWLVLGAIFFLMGIWLRFHAG